ncbi:unnamed protein product [Effrenium voratum]|nr:unnamed protein product [Effrenium voratum]
MVVWKAIGQWQVLSDTGLTHAVVAELGQCLASWRTPRLQPLIKERRSLLEKRLQLHQELQGESKGAQKELEALSRRLVETEQASEQLSITLDTFWEEVAAISDLSQEMQGRDSGVENRKKPRGLVTSRS